VGAILLRLWTGETDDLVLLDRTVFHLRDRPVLHHPIHGVIFQAGNKIHSLIRPASKELVVVVAAVIHDDRSRLQFKGSGDCHIVHLAGGDDAKARQVAVVIEQQVQLDGTFGGAKLGPIVHLQTQVDHGGIQAHQFVLEAELLRPLRPRQRQLGLKACEQQVKHILIQLPGPMLVHVREGRAGQRFNPQMRQLALAAPQSLFDLPQAVGTSQLAEQHRHELLPAAHSPRMPFGVELAHFALKVHARNKLDNLTEQAAKSVHVESFCCMQKRCGNRSSLHRKAQRLLLIWTTVTFDKCLIDAGWIEWALGVAEDLDPTISRLNAQNKTEA